MGDLCGESGAHGADLWRMIDGGEPREGHEWRGVSGAYLIDILSQYGTSHEFRHGADRITHAPSQFCKDEVPGYHNDS
jgi:hypothetical protein